LANAEVTKDNAYCKSNFVAYIFYLMENNSQEFQK
jgi:hypothetical protein